MPQLCRLAAISRLALFMFHAMPISQVAAANCPPEVSLSVDYSKIEIAGQPTLLNPDPKDVRQPYVLAFTLFFDRAAINKITEFSTSYRLCRTYVKADDVIIGQDAFSPFAQLDHLRETGSAIFLVTGEVDEVRHIVDALNAHKSTLSVVVRGP